MVPLKKRLEIGSGAGGVRHPSQDQTTRVRIPPEYELFCEMMAMLLFAMDFMCIVCVLKREIKALAAKIF
jgi:hypothetical protein